MRIPNTEEGQVERVSAGWGGPAERTRLAGRAHSPAGGGEAEYEPGRASPRLPMLLGDPGWLTPVPRITHVQCKISKNLFYFDFLFCQFEILNKIHEI